MNFDMNFSTWAFHQCVTLGNTVESIKDSQGKNINWVNTTTGEYYHKDVPLMGGMNELT